MLALYIYIYEARCKQTKEACRYNQGFILATTPVLQINHVVAIHTSHCYYMTYVYTYIYYVHMYV